MSQMAPGHDAPHLMADLVITGIGQLVTNAPAALGPALGGRLLGRHPSGDDWAPLGLVPDAALACSGGQVCWLGPAEALAGAVRLADGGRRLDAAGRAVLPGLVDCHTHAVYAGRRIDELAMRCRGASYEEIAAAGGGIRASTRLLRSASLDELIAQSLRRLRRMLARGVTTVEIKSGYGLNLEAELKMLAAIGRLRDLTPQRLVATALPAHAVPEEHGGPRDPAARASYLRQVLDEILPAVARQGIASTVDVFVEAVAFSHDDARAVAARAAELGLGLRLHVDQLANGGGARLAAELGARSADHLEHTDREGAAALAAAGTIAVILPLCPLYLGRDPWPDGRMLADAGCRVAVSTDCNPGSSVADDLWLAATVAATRCGLSLVQALQAVTVHAGAALCLPGAGQLAPGLRADLLILDDDDWRAPLYELAAPPAAAVVAGGALVIDRLSQ